jgi:hypothetical protein
MNYGNKGTGNWVSFKKIPDSNKVLGRRAMASGNTYGLIDEIIEEVPIEHNYYGYDKYIVRFKYIIGDYYPEGAKRRAEVLENITLTLITAHAFVLKRGLSGKTKFLVRGVFGDWRD